MDPDRWARVKEIFHAALERDPAQRESFLREACVGDPSLREIVESMLAREPDAAGFLESPALEAEAMAMAADLEGGEEARPPAPQPPVAPTPAAPTRLGVAPHQRREASVRPPWWMWFLAVVFLVDVLIRTYCYAVGPEWFGFQRRLENGRPVVIAVDAGGWADRAGIRPGDVLVRRDGRPIQYVSDLLVTYPNLEVGRTYRFEVERDGRLLELGIPLRRGRVADSRDWFVVMAWQAASVVMLATAILVAFKRPRDPVAGMGALTLAALSVSLWLYHLPPGYAVLWRSLPLGLGALLMVPNLAIPLVGPIGVTFFALFPRTLFRSRWLWALVWLPALCLVPVYVRGMFLIVYHPADVFGRISAAWVRSIQEGAFALYGLGMLAAITVNYFRLTDLTEKRRLRIMLAGGAAGTLPALSRVVVISVAPNSAIYDFLVFGWPDILIVLAFLAFPVSFAYAILRHRLLGVRVIVRMGVQYSLAKGLVISLVPILGVILVVDALMHGDQPFIEIVRARGWAYAVLAGLAVLAHALRHRMGRAIDRRFFHEQYDAGRLLREVAEQARRAGSLERAGPAVVARIEAALHPEFTALLFRPSGEADFRCVASAPAGLALPAVRKSSRVVALLRDLDRPLEVTGRDSGWLEERLSGEETDGLRRERVDLLVPIATSLDRHEALLVFGAKRSQEPYTREDLDSLAAIASSLALLLEGPTPSPDRTGSAFEECPRCGSCYDSGASRCAHEQAPLVPVGMPRTLAGRYRLERRLGGGGMGKVYEAVDLALDRRVAVKVIRDEWVHSTPATARFRREARVVAGFAHPNVVTVYDYGVEAGSRAFLVMELLHGDTMSEELRRSGRLDAARTVEIFRGVCGAVEAAHRHHLVHRDLKPDNIFLVDTAGAADAGGGAVKVLDFGVAKPLPGNEDGVDAEGGTAATEVGVLVGTIGYLSPEQLLGDPPDVSWDLWALAVVAYESLTGTLPFPVAPRDTWRRLVLAGRFTPLTEHLPDAPARRQAFFARALALDRARRPQSATEFLRQLEQALA